MGVLKITEQLNKCTELQDKYITDPSYRFVFGVSVVYNHDFTPAVQLYKALSYLYVGFTMGT